METFTFTPAPGAQERTIPRVLSTRFGDGYEQRIADGINTLPRMWQVAFTAETTSIDDVTDFLTARAGVEAFIWTPPRGASGNWICRDWNVDMLDASVQRVTATFEERFGDD
jgi:phage-related protein